MKVNIIVPLLLVLILSKTIVALDTCKANAECQSGCCDSKSLRCSYNKWSRLDCVGEFSTTEMFLLIAGCILGSTVLIVALAFFIVHLAKKYKAKKFYRAVEEREKI